MVIFYIILAYLVGCVPAYILWKHNVVTDGSPIWTKGDRAIALFISCFSWIVVIIMLLILGGSDIADKWHEEAKW